MARNHPQSIYLFGDQTADIESDLCRLLESQSNTIAALFFDRCYIALRREIAALPSSEASTFPRFTSIVDLVAKRHEKEPNPAVESALTCIFQLGRFISIHGDLGHPYPSARASHIVGLCTGLLSSVAISASKSIAELLPAAVQTVIVALRLGLCVQSVKELLGTQESTQGSWSALVSGVTLKEAEQLIQEFGENDMQKVSGPASPYISAVGSSGVTISGPPAVLARFTGTGVFRNKPVRTPIYGPFHASHLYCQGDIDRILRQDIGDAVTHYTGSLPVVSIRTGQPLEELNLRDLFQVALRDILLSRMHWDKVIQSCKSIVESKRHVPWRVIPMGTNAAQHLVATCKKLIPGDANPDLEIWDGQLPYIPKTSNATVGLGNSDIAIIGASGRFPEAASLESFWDLLYKGRDVHRKVPEERWNADAHVDQTGKKRNTSKVPYGCWINEPGLFDARFFNMSPREALQADPAQRLALLTAAEALEMAGFVPDSTPSTQRDRVGIFYGMTSDDYRETNSGQNIDTYFIPGGNRAFTPGRINYFFKFSGPSVSVDTACSSSLAAINLACNSIWNNDCDAAISGGVNVLTNPDNHAGLDRGHFLSRTGNCNTFDDGADGYCRADGVGTVILKRMEDALADNDPILAVIKGAYTNHSAEAVSITRPHVGAQSFIFKKLLNEKNIDPRDVSYIEMHGTGTQAGDAVEMQSVLDVFAPDYRRSPGESIHLGSTKANVGHGESASGVTALIKVLLMMRNNIIPPHCGIKTKINHNFPTDLAQRNVYIALEPAQWPKGARGKRTCFVNNFSAAGGNTALLIEDTPERQTIDRDTRPVHVVALSARSNYSLKNNIDALLEHIETQGRLPSMDESKFLANLAYTTTARRVHHPLRATAVCSNILELRDRLSGLSSASAFVQVPSVPSAVAFVFTGQGCQYIGMGKQLFEDCALFRNTVLHHDCLVRNQGLPSILPLIDGSVQSTAEMSPIVTQVGTACLQMALVSYWKSLGVTPSFVLGHSLGDFAALNAAGILSVGDAIYLCGRRAQLLLEHCDVDTHSMLAVKASYRQAQELLCGINADIACINGPLETVISGPRSVIDQISKKCATEGVKSTELKVPFAFHSAQVLPILEELRDAASRVSFQKPSVPFASSLLSEVITESGKDWVGPEYMVRQCRETVNFLGALEALRKTNMLNDETPWVEIGSHPICSNFIKSTVGPHITTVASLRRDENPHKTLSQSLSTLHLSGVAINWKEVHQDFTPCLQVLDLPSYKWELKDYWIPYKNNFCLLKGESAVDSPSPGEKAPAVASLSASAQRLVEERNEGHTSTVVVENDIADRELNQVIQGHKVNGSALTPSSLYADIAQTLCRHLIDKYHPELKGVGLDVGKVTVSKPLIAKPGQQLFRVSASTRWDDRCATINVYSVTPAGKKIIDHAECRVNFFDCSAEEQDWQRISFLIKRSIDALEQKADAGFCHRMQSGMVYKLFAALVDYDQNFKSIREVILDSEQYEATARVKFQAPRGNFHVNPFWIDSLGHLSGFVMNANDATDSKNHVFVNHGWDSMRCVERFSPDVTYRTYVKMQPWKDSLWAGDVYIFDGERVVAVFGGIKFQSIPRKVLDTFLPPAGASGTSRSEPAAKKPAVSGRPTFKEPKMAAMPSHMSGSPDIIAQALEILASEVGLASSELTDDLSFADNGVDSLLALTVTGRYREELDLNLDSSVFVECPTVKSFKMHLLHTDRRCSATSDSTSSGTESDLSLGPRSLSSSTSSVVSDHEKPTALDQSGTVDQVIAIISEEIGMPANEIPAKQPLADIGVDSLLSLTILGRMREELELDFSEHFLTDNATIAEISQVLAPSSAPPVVDTLVSSSNSDSTIESLAKPPMPATQHPPASSILLQGNPKTANKFLFLFPDGSGSATSYASIPGISPDVAVYGLNCPYMRQPENLKCSLDELTLPYLAEVRRRQPRGPYNLAGWSAGGICAFDAARRLILEHDEKVDRLILLDSPFPIGLEKLPRRLYGFFNSIGLFGEGKSSPPAWLLPHFLAFIDSLDAYRAVPLPYDSARCAHNMPNTYLIWAKEGVCGKPGDPRPEPALDGSPDPREMKWLLNDRTDLGPNKWDTLVGPENIKKISVMESANHFTMTKGEKGEELSSLLANFMDV